MVEEAGFGALSLIDKFQCDKPLVTAFLDRWRPETNTFFFRSFEATITLEDVVYILGLNAFGYPLYGEFGGDVKEVCGHFLGKTPPGVAVKGQCIRGWWLVKEFCKKLPSTATEEEVIQHTRAYLLYLVGSTILCDSGSNCISVKYLYCLESPDISNKYAWGNATLAHLYRGLSNSVLTKESAHFTGSVVLIMVSSLSITPSVPYPLSVFHIYAHKICICSTSSVLGL